MLKGKFSRTALLIAMVAAIALSVTGGTIAWFTDEVTSANNIIKSGKLDVEMLWAEGKEDPATTEAWKDASEGAIFNYDLWEPGYAEVRHVKISNEGDLALKYQLQIKANGEASELAEVIDVYAIPGAKVIKRSDLSAATPAGTLADVIANDGDIDVEGFLRAGAEESFTIALKMQESAGNEYQNKAIGADFAIILLATQYTEEQDAFDNQYDADAEYPEVEYPVLPDEWDGTADTSWYNDTDTEFTLDTAEQLAGLAKLVDDGITFEGKTITLDKDVDLYAVDEDGNQIGFNPIGHSSNGKSFNGTFDGQDYQITNLYMQSNLDQNNGGWLYEGEYYGLFAYTNGATIKNVTVADAYISSGRNEAAGVVGNAVDTNFENISIEGTTLIGYNNSVGGVAAECYGDCSFTGITVDENTVIGPLWGTYDVRLGGVVGMVQSGNNVSFSNINVACKLDAINDVAANYQYWLYRYCGMLIGQVDGVNGVADPTGYVTCENVTVTYGDWVNYHYCEFESLGAGSYNGPGEYKYARVEAGTGTNGIDLSTCNHDADESHNVLIVFDQLFGGGQGVSGLKTYDGVTVIYN